MMGQNLDYYANASYNWLSISLWVFGSTIVF